MEYLQNIERKKKSTEKKSTDNFSVVTLAIDNLFGDTKHSVDWFTSKNKIGVQITYTDFLSYDTTFKLLREILPSDVRLILKREISNASVAEFLMKEYSKNNVGIVDCVNGEIVAEPLRDFVRRRMKNMELV